MSTARAFFNVLTEDLDAATRPYLELLGFRRVFSSAWFVHLQSETNPALELGFLRRDHEVVPADARAQPVGGLLTLVVDDVDRVHRRILDHRDPGLTLLEPPRDLFYGQRRMLLRDPSGLSLDVSSECPPDPAWLARVRAVDGAHIEADDAGVA